MTMSLLIQQLGEKLNVNTEEVIDDIDAQVMEDGNLYNFIHEEKGIDIQDIKSSIESLVSDVDTLETALKEWEKMNQEEMPM